MIIDENTSDGFHTFKELYEFRMLYHAHCIREWSRAGKYDTHKSRKHSNGEECFGGGWFVVVAKLPSGQISNHYEAQHWGLFECDERVVAAEYDGHTPDDVVDRLRSELCLPPKTEGE